MTLFKKALLSNHKIQDILVNNGQVIDVQDHIDNDSHDIVNCDGKLLLSGMTDSHVHFRDPGFPQKEDASTGTKAALRGGVTSIIDMPNTSPLCVTPEELQHKKSIYQQNAYCNYGFHFGGDARDNSNNLPTPSEYASLKIFLNESTGHMLVTDDNVLDRLFQSSKFISVHAEGDAVDKAIYFAKKHSNTLYLCHISQQEEVQLIVNAKNQNLNIFAEVCPHHVVFNNSQTTNLLTMKPQLRSKRDQECMLEALDRGIIDTWGTDHAPHLISEKEAQLTYGIPSIEFSLEILLTLSKDMNWSYQKVEELYSRTPRNIFQIKNNTADFVLIDQAQDYIIQDSDIVSKCGWSPYVGYHAKSKIQSTFIGGEEVYNAQTQTFKKSSYIKELNYDR